MTSESARWLTMKEICAERDVDRETVRRWHHRSWVERRALGTRFRRTCREASLAWPN
jgi:hypothetical protein